MYKTNLARTSTEKQLEVTRRFRGPVSLVWRAWTESDLLDQWWAPKPWKTVTQHMDFSEGGYWLYVMNGPEGEQHWCRADYTRIKPGESFTGTDYFADEHGNASEEFPKMHWYVRFEQAGADTQVRCLITFDSVADLEKIVEMGFEEGFTMAHGNLDALLEELLVEDSR